MLSPRMGHFRQPIESLEPRRLLTADIDLAFGIPGRGKAFFSPGPDAHVRATALQSDGKIVVAGRFDDSRYRFVQRLNADGSPDKTFGAGGLVKLDFGDGDSADELLVLPDDKILVGGVTGKRSDQFDQFYSNNGPDARSV